MKQIDKLFSTIVKLNLKLLFVVTLFTLHSCNKKVVAKKERQDLLFQYEFNFPDTVYLNETYHGELKYKSILDTIITNFDNQKKSRYVFYSNSIFDKLNDEKKLRTMCKDTVGATDNTTIPIKYKFTKHGDNFIDGIINDHVTIETDEKDNEGEILYRYIEKEIRATHKVYVINQERTPLRNLRLNIKNDSIKFND